MFKKALSLLLALMLIVTSVSVTALSVAAAEGEEEQEASTFYVVGDNADLFGAAWGDGMIDDNAMTANEDGTYTKVYEGVGPIDKVISLKVTDGVNWIGTATGNNVAIELNDNTDLTVKYDPKAEGNQVTVTGEGVKMHEFNPAAVEVMRVVGSAQGSFLNNQSWKEAADENNMTKISDGVYEIVFEEMEAFDSYQFKFAANGSWTDNFGTEADAVVGKECAAKYDGGNIYFDVPEDDSTVTITLDMSKFDLQKGQFDATYKIKVVNAEGEEYIPEVPEETTAPVEETTAAPVEETTAAPVEETTAAPVSGDKLKVVATSNITPTITKSFDPTTEQITVTYWIDMTDKWMVNAQWVLAYDKDYLTVDMTDGVNVAYNARTGKISKNFVFPAAEQNVVNFDVASMPQGGIKGNCSNLDGYDLCTEEGGKIPFVTVTFNPTGKTGETEVNLNVEIVNVQGPDDAKEDYFIKDSEIVQNISYLPTNTPSAIYAGPFDNDVEFEPDAEEPTTTEAPTTTEEPTTTEAPTTTEEPTTTEPAPVGKHLTVRAYSNSQYFKEATNSYYEPNIPEQVTVQFFIDTEAYQMVNGQFEVEFDPTVLALNEASNKSGRKSTVTPAASASEGTGIIVNWDNLKSANRLPINFTNITDGGIWLTDEEGNALPVIQLVFDVVGDGDTEVFLDTTKITLNTAEQPVDPTTWFEADKNNDNYNELLAQFAEKADMTFVIQPEGQTPVAPTTVEPTTVEPTTVAPTDLDPTEPTTVAPTDPAPSDVFVLAGTTNWLSTGWSPDPDSYVMDFDEASGLYTITVPDVAANEGEIYAVKVVQFIEGDGANAVWHGMDGTDLNVDFMLNKDCDVTVTYNPETGEITVTGDGVVPPVYNLEAIYAVGESGGTTFLTGESWKQDAESNKMTEVADGVYEITYEDVDTNTNYQFKFAANGGWDINWGFGPSGSTNEIELNTPSDSTYNGGNATFAVESLEDTCKITLQLDISNWDPAKKDGAKITVFVNREDEEPTTVEPTTVEPTTVEPTTVEPTTVEPTTVEPTTVEPTTVEPTTVEPTTVAPTLKFNNSAVVSDFDKEGMVFGFNVTEASGEVKVGETFTLNYVLDTDQKVESFQFKTPFDNTKVELVDVQLPQFTTGAMINKGADNAQGNASNINGYTVVNDQPVITLTFKAIADGETDIVTNLTDLLLTIEQEPSTVEPTTVEPTTVEPTTVEPTTVEPTTVEPTTVEPTTVEPTTVEPTTVEPTTVEPTTVEPTTVEPTTVEPTTVEPTTVEPTTVEPTTVEPVEPTTVEPTTVEPTTVAPTTTPDATSVTEPTTKKATSDSATKDSSSSSSSSSNGTVKTGSASMAVIILLVLVSATAAIFFARRRERK